MMHENKKKSGRFVWSQELHNKFVDAVQQLGIEKASPKKILQLINDEKLTYQHVSSHLQKYKLRLEKTSCTMSHQQQCPINNDVGLDIHELPPSSSKQFCQSNNTNDAGIHTQMGVLSTSTSSNEQFECWNNLTPDATFNYSSKDLFCASFTNNCCSEITAKIAELREEMAMSKDENLKLREIIQDMMVRQDMLMNMIFYRPSHQVISTLSNSAVNP